MNEIIKISLDDEELHAALGRMIASLRDTTPTMRALSETVIDASLRAFDTTSDPATGTPWKPLSKSRQRQRVRKGRSIANILQDSGRLVGSIERPSSPDAIREIGADRVFIGTNVPYAAAHQFGATIQRAASPMSVRLRRWKGRTEFAKKTHKRVRVVDTVCKAYTITIPARPFLGIGATDIQEMLDTITRHIQKAYMGQNVF